MMIKKKNHTFLFSWIFLAMINAQNTTIPVNVGVVLDFDSGGGKTAKVYLSCIEMALSDIYASHPYFKTRIVLNTRNSKQTVVGAAAAALDLIKNAEVLAILGPETSMQASFIVNLGDEAHVPILSFSASAPYLTSLRSPYFFRITQTDSYQVKAISSIVQNFGWRQVVPIYVDNMYGEGIIPFLIDALQDVDAHVPYRSVISPSATGDQILKELYKLMTMQTRVFIVHMKSNLCFKLFSKAKEIGMMSKGYVWILTDGISNRLNSMNSSAIASMEGVLGIKTFIPRTTELEKFELRWKGQFQQDNPTIIDVQLDVYALQAYDAAFALAVSIENVGISTSSEIHKDTSFNSTDLDTYKVSENGPKLAEALSITRFKGIAGDFKLVEGQLQSSTFTIVNIKGEGGKPVAFWTPQNQMVKKLNDSTNTSILSTNSKSNLGPIKWPGNSLSVPRGWEIPTNGKKLIIGVPVKIDFTEFVKISKDPKTGTMDVTGFCIDVFHAALKVLPYALPYEFAPFTNPDGTSAGNYNDLVYQVYLGKFDAVVGDTTIRANRSLYVDFTMPYTESGVVMVVPIIDTTSKNAWVFLKPLTWDLWLTTFCFFLFTGFVVWVLEHRINEDFRGPPSHQFGTSVWFSFSTMVFSQKENVISNLTRFVMIIWVFVVLILTQTYTANLASLLTVQQLKPTVVDIKDLLRKGDNVGYSKNAYVYGLLKEVGFNDSNLKGFRTMEALDEALSKGSANGGIAAFVDETPTMKLFLAKYCSKYTMIGPIFKTEGFGFVFPKRSPLVPDVSQAILDVTEGEKMMSIESKWFKKESNCQSSSQLGSSNSLGLDSFWGLFLIAGVASIFALIIFVASFLYENGHLLIDPDSEASTSERIRVLFKIFNQKDLNSRTFKSSQPRDRITGARDEVNISPNYNWPESPFSYSNHSDGSSEQLTPPPGQASSESVPRHGFL
ncbi:glutamate receptor 2.7-like isoform X1 [Rosa rugosa]|uniref:glutamate receptor 2.7-like isoform X1 n=1 Tax=Rosa rugosa TaxID=74645 RepID=UPI002B410097|nr:glutamate receptor 2.7-like isoform X1 [Rosa rugosa]